jgi:very-short-patch-repair endonuclease
MSKLVTLNTEKFVERSNIIHDNEYDYSLVYCNGNRTKVNILCRKHGLFKQKAASHLRGQRCKRCVSSEISNGLTKFINKSNIIHSNKYDYSKSTYVNNKTKIEIVCKKHGSFYQRPDSHIKGNGCIICKYNSMGDKFRNDFNEDINIMINKHNNKYDYSMVEFKNNKDKVKIICKKHGIFKQSLYSHKRGLGCYMCRESKGEIEISNILDKNNIKYIKQKRFNDCIDKKTLPFDFYLIDHNTCVEFDGKQHFESIDHWGGVDTLNKVKRHDVIKNEFCKSNNINLYRISFSDNVLDEMIKIILKIKE